MKFGVWVGLANIAVVLGLASPAFCEPEYVAYVDHIYPAGTKLSSVLRVERAGIVLPISGFSVDLKPGDKIYVNKPGQIPKWEITIRYITNNEVVRVASDGLSEQGDQAVLTVHGSSLPGLSGKLFALLKAVFSDVDQSGGTTVTTASRGIAISGTCFNDTGRSDAPISFDIPILTADRSQIVEGPRALFVSWRGGAEPFSVVLADTATGAIVAQSANVHDVCAVRLPRTDLKPGRYRLSVVDANNTKEGEDNLFVVDQSPQMPPQLRDAPLPDEARQLYFATWLAAIDRGEWAFEAQQLVASMDCHSAAVQDWLRRWGGVLDCR